MAVSFGVHNFESSTNMPWNVSEMSRYILVWQHCSTYNRHMTTSISFTYLECQLKMAKYYRYWPGIDLLGDWSGGRCRLFNSSHSSMATQLSSACRYVGDVHLVWLVRWGTVYFFMRLSLTLFEYRWWLKRRWHKMFSVNIGGCQQWVVYERGGVADDF